MAIKQTVQLFGEPTILIVEDDLQLAKMFSRALNVEGYQTVVIHNGRFVGEVLGRKNVQLVLLDIMLPGKDGFEVLKEMKADKKTRDIPVILLTNLGEVEYMEKGLKLGAADYIIKHNVDFPKMRKVLAKHLISMDARKNMSVE